MSPQHCRRRQKTRQPGSLTWSSHQPRRMSKCRGRPRQARRGRRGREPPQGRGKRGRRGRRGRGQREPRQGRREQRDPHGQCHGPDRDLGGEQRGQRVPHGRCRDQCRGDPGLGRPHRDGQTDQQGRSTHRRQGLRYRRRPAKGSMICHSILFHHLTQDNFM